jgi:antitoxin ParD1/3/4
MEAPAVWEENGTMHIEIRRPELEALIQKRLQSGAFDSVEEILFRALEAQDEQEDWLQENRDAINRKIELAMAQLDRGEGIPGDQLRGRLETRKAAFLAENRRE